MTTVDRHPAAEDLALAASLLGRRHDQLGFVVPDLDAATAIAAESFGMRPLVCFEYGDGVFGYRSYEGSPARFQTRSAVFGGGRLSFVQPVSGASSYRYALERFGPGLHHAGFLVEELASHRERLLEAGEEEIMTAGGHGLDGDGALSFFTVNGRRDLVIELIQPPRRRRSPDHIIA